MVDIRKSWESYGLADHADRQESGETNREQVLFSLLLS